MEFNNQTSFPTLSHRSALEDDIIAMSVMCRVTYDIVDGIATISDKQTWEIRQNQWESDYGLMDKDDVYSRGGVDIMVFGSAKAPTGKTLTESEVKISLNEKEVHKVKIFGDRVWNSFLGIMSISKPEAFTEIDLNLNNAFGGTAKWDGLEIPYPSNPYGKGYYYTKEEAIGNVLPNIEHYDNPITKWNSWQEPAGVCSFPIMGLRAKYNLVLNEAKTKIEKLDSKFFNSAFPQLIVENIEQGDKITIDGVTNDGVFELIIPDTHLRLEIKLGEKINSRKMLVDQIGIVPNKEEAFISYRFPFRYKINPMEKREVNLKLRTL
ncbi:DUF2169 domain-containing protein [Zobellia amurskyensis]|uniref:DUF2169 domain-containing protein n=1 Tax=Zobellia amurskyensis TaxID=248905 RepID=A0A7X2ZQT5_9FLAO|nr:DUF2169 domain-containing protein [Zobellia amurskyensis]MUH34691.1 DUF2169 domain-containing protein [Zobellia amurskyensis]